MLERYLEEEAAKRLEMKLLILSLYEDVYNLVNGLRRADKLIKASSKLLRGSFGRELNDLERDTSMLINSMSKLLGGSMDDVPRREDVRLIRDHLSKVNKKVNELLSKVEEEIELSTSVIGEVLRRIPETGTEIKFLASRIEEAPAKIDYMPSNYLEMLIDLVSDLLPPYEGSVKPIEDKLDEIGSLLREFHSDLGDKALSEGIRDLIETVSYLRFLVGRFKQLAPGVIRYLDELKSSSIIFPSDGDH